MSIVDAINQPNVEDQSETGFVPGKSMNILSQNIIQTILRGGQIINDHGLIYATRFNTDTELTLVATGFEYQNGAPNINIFSFDLTPLVDEDTGDFKLKAPQIQSPVQQQFIADYPLIAYKSFMSDNSEIVIMNLALKKEPAHILNL